MDMKKSWKSFVVLFCCMAVLLSGCGSEKESSKKIVLTNGFDKNEVFRIETASCSLPEVNIYLANTKNRYENIYGSQIWETKLGTATLEERVKETVLAELAQIKVMKLLAEKYEVALDAQEQELANKAGEEYFGSLGEAEAKTLGVTKESVSRMYEEYAISDKVYHYIIKDINPEISDDEARTITVEHILIKTYSLDHDGNRVPFGEEERKAAYEKAQEALAEVKAGEDFNSLVSKYNEDNKSIYSFRKGEMDASFEKAAFNLGTDEVSDIVETQYGYHIIKCINTFNREETDANKVKIVEQRRKEVFSQEYDAFADSLTRNLNTELWESVSLIHDKAVVTTQFFEIYDKWFDGAFGEDL